MGKFKVDFLGQYEKCQRLLCLRSKYYILFLNKNEKRFHFQSKKHHLKTDVLANNEMILAYEYTI